MKRYRCVAVRDSKGLINIDITEIYNVDDDSERYPAGFRQWRIGQVISEDEIFFHEGIAYNKKLFV